MKYTIRIKHSAEKELNKIPLEDYKRIAGHIFLLEDNPRPMNSRKLKDKIYRIRVGNYRVIYSIDDTYKIVEVLKVG
ncbi:MAG: type II toxin-antitoxin system RelE/ParE family toxin, partial [Elusimicrobiota bacterium]